MTPLHGRWRRSSYSGDLGGNCVECAHLPSTIALRDSKHPDKGHFTFPSPEWTAFLAAIRHGQL
ncbi:DUF397 domain-containing protein [Marinitenerispora sediminis]|uniref:DUF397 domain-containing protein n=1 Tax=Marinitenerispora sediminis TaxID=1931232 RepID=A0A368TA51_9ACTN|nr:DUF397 domain-containing protein [Marinitenerispora sediminis]RCV52455.1 DUF397 domain-containing protein [Marinitenerispora sediminis]RCV54964.1 DUF397 domain-containing protein [Marinitenerispora sediminis]RCV61423.1 DUF397 domain-containing protein [Marinitenerispora sediminis]